MARFADITECVPTPFSVGGVRMRPFCLGHHLLFRKLNLPFAVSPEADCGFDEVLVGAILCAFSYEEGLEAIASGKLPKLIRQWRRKLRFVWLRTRPSMEDLEAAFRDYLRDGYRMPPVRTYQTSSGIILTAPWEIMLKTKLGEYGLSESEILNGYLPARRYEYFSAIEWDAVRECEDSKAWRKLFWTAEDQAAVDAAGGAA